MTIQLLIKHWIPHLNQILYSLSYYCYQNNQKHQVIYSNEAPYEGAILIVNNIYCLLDFSDSPKTIDFEAKYDYYFKRSLSKTNINSKILPLNFQTNFSFRPLSQIIKMDNRILKNATSKTEIVRALDYFNLVTKDSHSSKNINRFPKKINDNDGRIIFLTRLWNPNKTDNTEEKERRIKQNEYRINACRTISKNFKNSITGLYPDEYSSIIAKDILIDLSTTTKKNYLSELKKADIGIADDGLFDTPGWKIGEYIMSNKAIITTPINVHIHDFKEDINYLKTRDRNDYESLPALIDNLITDRKYMVMKKNNKKWYNQYLEPEAFIKNIFSQIKELSYEDDNIQNIKNLM